MNASGKHTVYCKLTQNTNSHRQRFCEEEKISVIERKKERQRESEKSTVSPKKAKYRHNQVTYIESAGSFSTIILHLLLNFQK